jgi:hypothetical protein
MHSLDRGMLAAQPATPATIVSFDLQQVRVAAHDPSNSRDAPIERRSHCSWTEMYSIAGATEGGVLVYTAVDEG